MKKLYLCALITLIGLCIAGQVFAQNLLLNPGFEDSLNDWDDLYGLPADLSETVFHGGATSATKYVDTVDGQAYWSQLYQDIDCAAGGPVYASMYIKTTFSPEANARTGVMLQFLDSDDSVIAPTLKSRNTGGMSDWQLLGLSAQAAPVGTVKARLSAYLWAAQDDTLSLQGEAYYDDATLEKIYRPIPLPTALRNPGFENGLIDWTDLFGYPTRLTSAVVRTGTYAAFKKVEEVAERDYWSTTYQDIACAARKKVTASVYIKTQFATRASGKGGIQIEFMNVNNRVLKKVSKTLGGAYDWRKIATTATVAPTGTVKVRYSLYIYAPMGNTRSLNGTVYFDDAALTIQ